MSDDKNKERQEGFLIKGFKRGVKWIVTEVAEVNTEKMMEVRPLFHVDNRKSNRKSQSSGKKQALKTRSEHAKKNNGEKKHSDKKSCNNRLKKGRNKAALNVPREEETHPAPDKPDFPSQEVDLQDLEQRAILQVSGMTGMAELLTRMCTAADLENWPTFVFLASSYQTKGARLEEILSLCGENQKFLSDHALYLRLLKISNLLKEQGIESDTAYTPDQFPAEKLKPCAAAISQNWRRKEGTKDET